MTDAPTLERDAWSRLVASAGGDDAPSQGQLETAVADALDLSDARAVATVDAALADGVLRADPDAGLFGAVRVADPDDDHPGDPAGAPGTDPADECYPTDSDHDLASGVTPDEPTPPALDVDPTPATVDTWDAVAFDALERDVWPPAHLDVDAWMLRKAGKAPWAPWADPDAPVECSKAHDGHDGDETVTCADCRHSARYKWGSSGSREHVHADAATALEWRDKHPEARDDLVFIQSPDDPFAFVDGDDVRDPETGAVHPGFVDVLEALGVTYADVSTSDSGIHALYRGALPDGVKQATWELDTEPFGANDEPPAVEIYDGKHVCVATGRHLPETGTRVEPWDDDALRDLLDEHGALPSRASAEGYEAFDADDYDPGATSSAETTTDIRDVYAALDRLDARRVADLTIAREWFDDAGEHRAFRPTWAPSDYDGTAVFANSEVFKDSGRRGGKGGPACMAAIDAGLVSDTDCPDAVRGETWVKAVEHLRTLGFDVPKYAPSDDELTDTEAVSALPLSRLDALEHTEARRYAKRHGVDWPTTREARRRLRDELVDAVRTKQRTVLDAPTALGKSYTVATEPWAEREDISGGQPVVQLAPTCDARDENVGKSAGVTNTHDRLLGRTEACPVAAGYHDPADDPDDEDAPDVVVTMNGTPASEWLKDVCDRRGVPFSVAHAHLAEHNDQGLDRLPCEALPEDVDADDDEGTHACPATKQWDRIRDHDLDVIHATHPFAFVPGLVAGKNVVFDEAPDFTADLTTDRMQRAVTAFLREVGAPVSTWEAFVGLATHDGVRDDAAAERDRVKQLLDVDPDREWYLTTPDAHTLAPALARAVWYALRDDADANGLRSATVPHEPPRLDAHARDTDEWARTWVRVVLDDTNRLRRAWHAPDLSGARSVVGLDAHPSLPLWQLNVGPGVDRRPVLDPDERALWRRFERGLLVVQVGDDTNPLASGEYYTEAKTRAFIGHLREQYGDRFDACITASSVEDRTRQIMREVGVDDPETMHFGEEKSRDDFGDKDVLAVDGSIDPGDHLVEDVLAALDLDARPETVDTDDGERRAKGRGFVGPDADAAADVLASVRENHVAQSAGRAARNADDPDDHAVAFVRTDAIPPGFADVQVPGVEWVATDKQRAVVEALRDRPSATARELADATGVSKRHVADTLARLVEHGTVACREGAGKWGADVYRALAGAAPTTVDLEGDAPAVKIASDRVWSTYTWALAIRPGGTTTAAGAPDARPDEPARVATDGGDPPPTDTD